PMRKHFVVDENLPFPDGIAAAETLKVLDPPRGVSTADEAWIQARRAATVLGMGMLISAVLMFFREDARIQEVVGLPTFPEGWSPDSLSVSGPLMLGVAGAAFAVAKMGVGVSYSLLNIGSGMIIGFRVTFW